MAFIKFHQCSSKKQGFEKNQNFNGIWRKPGFHQISSKFIKVHQNSSKLNSFEKCNNQWLKPDLDLQHLEKVEINVTNDCWTLVLVLNSYVLYVCLVSNTNLFWLGKYWKTCVLLNKKCFIYVCFILFWLVLMYCFGLVEKSWVFFHLQNN